MSGKEVPLMHQSALLFSVTNVLYINKFIFVNIGCSGKKKSWIQIRSLPPIICDLKK